MMPNNVFMKDVHNLHGIKVTVVDMNKKVIISLV
jgi:hypothetical protein